MVVGGVEGVWAGVVFGCSAGGGVVEVCGVLMFRLLAAPLPELSCGVYWLNGFAGVAVFEVLGATG